MCTGVQADESDRENVYWWWKAQLDQKGYPAWGRPLAEWGITVSQPAKVSGSQRLLRGLGISTLRCPVSHVPIL